MKAIRRPDRVAARIRRQVGRVQNRMLGTAVMAEDWDNLLVLDACRYDTFAEMHSLPGRLESRRSRGSATEEFVRNNFAGRTFRDTVYVSANPYVSDLANDAFHHLDPVWRTGWDDAAGTVLPETMAAAIRDAAERFPNKRLVGHFMQPHHPFLGPTAERELPDSDGYDHARHKTEGTRERTAVADDLPDHIWNLLEEGRVDPAVVETAYRETLDRVLPYVDELRSELPGKTVVTSDHGNLFDDPAYEILSIDAPRFAHPPYATASELVTVPWHVCPHTERKTVTSDPPDRSTETVAETETQELKERLEALGYR